MGAMGNEAYGAGVEVVRAGMHDTVQDRGRFGLQALGFSPGGAMDRRSAEIANIVVGNPAQAAVLECAFYGPLLRFERPAVVCVTGASADFRLDGASLEPYAAHAVETGQTLDLGRASWGVYSYLAVAGGIDVSPVMGSRSTSCAYGLGGLAGRALRSGDVLPLRSDAPVGLAGVSARRLASHDAYFRRDVDCDRPTWIRVVPASDELRLGPGWLRSFYCDPFRVTPRSDRMGVRLAPCGEGVAVERVDLVSEGVVLGCVQVPASGEPIVVMADHQTTGGYAKAGVVASVDLPRLAQLRPGQEVRFERIDVEGAQRLAREEAAFLSRLRADMERAASRMERV